MENRAWPEYFEWRFYSIGWTLRIGMFLVRWNKQDAYTQLCFERVGRGYQQVGGMTWKEFKLSRQQAREAAEIERNKHKEKQ